MPSQPGPRQGWLPRVRPRNVPTSAGCSAETPLLRRSVRVVPWCVVQSWQDRPAAPLDPRAPNAPKCPARLPSAPRTWSCSWTGASGTAWWVLLMTGRKEPLGWFPVLGTCNDNLRLRGRAALNHCLPGKAPTSKMRWARPRWAVGTQHHGRRDCFALPPKLPSADQEGSLLLTYLIRRHLAM